MATETVKVYEEKPKKGLPIWAWLLPLLLLLALAFWLFSRHNNAATATAQPAPVADQTKPDNGAAPVWTAATIADSIRTKGSVGFDDNAVHFATASATLAGDSQAVLDQTAEALKANPDWKMRVVGYTDSTGAPAANDQLAQQRANSVMTYLSSHGIDQGRLSVAGKGQAEPVATNATNTGRSENRRVELIKQ